MENKKLVGHLAALSAYLIFGFNIIICKDITTSSYLPPISIFLLRSLGAGAIFWLLSLFMPKEKVRKKDYLKIFMASLFGFFLTQVTFLMAIPLITPMESSLINALVPIFTMFVAAMAIHEPITAKKVTGVLVSFLGVVYLIVSQSTGTTSGGGVNLWGALLQLANGLFFAIYLGMFRPLIERYSVVTFMKWVFLFSTLTAIPFGAMDVIRLDVTEIPSAWFWEMAFLIVFATFTAYFLIPLAQKLIRPTLISMYSYVQPIIAIGTSIWIGYDVLTLPKVVACLMVFGGVYIVSRSRSAGQLKSQQAGLAK